MTFNNPNPPTQPLPGQPVYGPPSPQVPVGPGGLPAYPSAPGYGAYGPTPAPGAPTPYGQPSPYGPMLDAPRPGIAPLRPLRTGEILHGALSAFRHNPAVALGLPALILLIASLLGLLIGRLFYSPIDGWLTGVNHDLATQLGDNAMTPELTVGAASSLADGVGTGLVSMLATPIIGGLLAISISRSLLGDRISASDLWSRLRPRIPALIGWTFLSALIMAAAVAIPLVAIIALAVAVAQASVGGAVALGIVLGLAWAAFLAWLTTRLLLVPPTIALEGRPLGESIRRGWNLSRGSFWRLFGIYLLATFLVSAITSLVTAPLGLMAGLNTLTTGAAAMGGIGTLIASLVSTWISTILTSSIIAFLYLDTRMRRENLDATLRASVPAAPVGYRY